MGYPFGRRYPVCPRRSQGAAKSQSARGTTSVGVPNRFTGVISLAESHLTQVDERIRQLRAFRGRLAAALTKWRAGGCGFASEGAM